MADWTCYRKCEVCGAVTGEACRTRSGRVVDGRPDGVTTVREEPHAVRVLRSARMHHCRAHVGKCPPCTLARRVAAEDARRAAARG